MSFFLILICAILIFNRKENVEFLRPKILASSHTDLRSLLNYLVFYKFYFITRLAKQVISLLLLMGGIELNPGPPPPSDDLQKDKKDTNLQTLDIKSKQAKCTSGICSISHLCEVSTCYNEIFAACHCNKCKGFAPLLCYHHFINDSCCPRNSNIPSIKTKQTSARKSGSQIECSICFKSLGVMSIGLSEEIWQAILNSKGKFIFLCQKCCNSSEEDIALNTSNPTSLYAEHIKEQNASIISSDPRSSIRIIPKHRHLIPKLHYPSKDAHLNSSDSEIRDSNIYEKFDNSRLTNSKNLYVTPLLSLKLRPPPAQIFLKWHHYLLHNRINFSNNFTDFDKAQLHSYKQTNSQNISSPNLFLASSIPTFSSSTIKSNSYSMGLQLQTEVKSNVSKGLKQVLHVNCPKRQRHKTHPDSTISFKTI